MKKKTLLIPLLIAMMSITGCNLDNEEPNTEVKVTGVELVEDSLTMEVGETKSLTWNILPIDATDKTVSWSTSNEDAVSVNNGSLTALASGTSTITVTTNDGGFADTCLVTVSEVLTDITVSFTVTNNNDVSATVDKTTAKPGDEIIITITDVKDGYDLDSITLKGSNDQIIAHSAVEGNANKFKYVQPSDGVCKLTVKLIGKTIKGYISDEHSLIDGAPKLSVDNGATFTNLTIAGQDEGRNYYNLVYGAKVVFHLKDTDDFKATGLKIDGVLYQVDTNKDVTFNVEIDDFEYFFVDIKVQSEYLKPATGEYEFNFINSSHLSMKTYKSDLETEIAGSNQNDIVYIHVLGVDDDYSVREIKVTAPTSDISSPVETNVTKIDDEWFSFKTPFSYSKVITITLIEANNTILKNSSSVGKYACVSIAPATRNFDAFNDQTVEIKQDGSMTMKYNESTSKTEVFIADDGSKLTTSGTSGSQIPYGDNFLFFCTDGDSSIKAPFGTYNTLCVKLEKEDDVIADYKVHGERFVTEDNHVYVSITVSKENVNYASAFIDMTNKTAYFGVNYNVIVGTKVNDNIVLYEVKSKSNEKIAVVGSNGTGTYLSRCKLGAHYGTYTKDTNTLTIVGSIKATYNDESFAYTLVDNTITLTSSTREIVLTLDATNKTFVIVSDTTTSLSLPEFAGKRFRSGQFDIEDNICYYGFYIEFSSTDLKMSTAGGSDYNLDMDHHSTQTFAVNVDVDYTYDSSTKVVTASIKIKGGSTKSVKFTYNNGAFYVQAKDLYSGFYSKNVKLTELK